MIPIWDADHNLQRLIPSLQGGLGPAVPPPEIIVSAGPRRDDIRPLAEELGARFIPSTSDGYGEILRAGLAAATGEYVLTMDGDYSHLPGYVRTMWRHRHLGEVLIASRYLRGSFVEMSLVRRIFSRLLNFLYRKALALPYRDISSAFRMYRRRVLLDVGLPQGRGLDVLPELLVKAFSQGWQVSEVPFWYRGARPISRARALRLGWGFFRTLGRLFALRNSVKAADYDHRAFDSWIPLQRHWQRKRFRIIQGFIPSHDLILDIGCGSSRIVQHLPRAVGMDLAIRKLRWLRAPGRMLLQGDMGKLPFPDGVFDGVICSEVIEHVTREQVSLAEMARVIRPGGLLVLGTPDYSKRMWRTLEWIYGKVFPGGYVSEHINQYTYEGLRAELISLGLEVLDCRYIGGSEMIFKARVPASVPIPDMASAAG